MSFGWYVRRVRSMSPSEILHRTIEVVRKSHSRGRHEGWARYTSESVHVPKLAGIREAVALARPEQAAAILAASARVREGRFAALGVEWPRVGRAGMPYNDAWRMDPVTGGPWPNWAAYCFDIGYRHARSVGDVKYIWEFNRLQFLQPLAAEVVLTGDAEALALIEEIIQSWAEQNPPFRGAAWSELLNVAIRAISLLFVSSLCGEALPPLTQRTLAAAIEAHRFWIHRFPSLHSSANNHLVAELAALFLIEAGAGRMASAEGQRCWGALAQEIDKQFFEDGVNAEQSPTYGAFTAEFLLLVFFVARQEKRTLPPETVKLARFARHVATLARPTGDVPSIGDNDEGRVISLCAPERHYAHSIACNIAAFLELAGEDEPGNALRDTLFGRRRISIESGVHLFRDGGLTVIRDTFDGRNLLLTFDHGPLGYLSIAAHGHADALSITLTLDEMPVFVDPGTYLYHSGGDWRDWFRGTAAHNTLNIHGANQSAIAGAFNWSSKANAHLDACHAEGGAWRVTASHDGYEARFGVHHRREIARLADGFEIRDWLDGSATPVEAEIVFQLAPGIDVQLEGREARLLAGETLLVTLHLPDNGKIETKRGGELTDGVVGWVSSAFGSKEPANRLAWRGYISDGVVTVARIAARDRKKGDEGWGSTKL